jgi:hypothetical protein
MDELGLHLSTQKTINVLENYHFCFWKEDYLGNLKLILQFCPFFI